MKSIVEAADNEDDDERDNNVDNTAVNLPAAATLEIDFIENDYSEVINNLYQNLARSIKS